MGIRGGVRCCGGAVEKGREVLMAVSIHLVAELYVSSTSSCDVNLQIKSLPNTNTDPGPQTRHLTIQTLIPASPSPRPQPFPPPEAAARHTPPCPQPASPRPSTACPARRCASRAPVPAASRSGTPQSPAALPCSCSRGCSAPTARAARRATRAEPFA